MELPLCNLVPSELVAKLFALMDCSSCSLVKVKSGYRVKLNFIENFENRQEGDSEEESVIKYRRKSKFQSTRDLNRLLNYNDNKCKETKSTNLSELSQISPVSNSDSSGITVENETRIPTVLTRAGARCDVTDEILSSPGGTTLLPANPYELLNTQVKILVPSQLHDIPMTLSNHIDNSSSDEIPVSKASDLIQDSMNTSTIKTNCSPVFKRKCTDFVEEELMQARSSKASDLIHDSINTSTIETNCSPVFKRKYTDFLEEEMLQRRPDRYNLSPSDLGLLMHFRSHAVEEPDIQWDKDSGLKSS